MEFHRRRRAGLVADYLNELNEAGEVKQQVLESCRRDLEDLKVTIEDVQDWLQ